MPKINRKHIMQLAMSSFENTRQFVGMGARDIREIKIRKFLDI